MAAVSQPALGTYGQGHAAKAVDLKLNMAGYVKPHCSIHIPDDKIWTEITDEAGTATTEFEVDCNQYMKVEISSRNGGLLHEASNRIPDYPGFTDFVPYNLTFNVNAPDAKPINLDSQHIKDTPGHGSIQTIPFAASGELTIAWAPEEHLIAGTYRDVIEIRITGDGGSNSY